jgi:hypothetical protein
MDGEPSTLDGDCSTKDGEQPTLDGACSTSDGERSTMDGERSTSDGAGSIAYAHLPSSLGHLESSRIPWV